MERKINIAGAAPPIGILTLLYQLVTIIISLLMEPAFQIVSDSSALIIAGIIWVIPGIIMVVISAKMLLKSFNQNKLMQNGLYRIFRNPMYAAYFMFVIPGICLLFNSWLVLTTVPVNYVLIQIFIQKEYIYLKEKFGKEYDDYLKTVLIRFL
jgi:protein-S-isoprenylcysteine O-methyltransferase Ste14